MVSTIGIKRVRPVENPACQVRLDGIYNTLEITPNYGSNCDDMGLSTIRDKYNESDQFIHSLFYIGIESRETGSFQSISTGVDDLEEFCNLALEMIKYVKGDK